MSHAAVRTLAVHAGYRCHHAGACCSSNWPIPIEPDQRLRVQSALASGALRPVVGDARTAIEAVPDELGDAPALLARVNAQCVFFEADAEVGVGRCRIHTSLGHDALPLACRQFPRVSLLDPRGASVTLSHYCPTAAGLLEAETSPSPAISIDPAAFPSNGEYVGLDVRKAWPPLLRPGVLMDWDSWWLCEELAVKLLLSDLDRDSRIALSDLRRAIGELQRWTPDDEPLGDRVRAAFDAAKTDSISAEPANPALVNAVYASIPPDLRPERFADTIATKPRAAHRFLAAHAFANWKIHEADGLPAWLVAIETARAFLTAGAGVRHADLVLRHLTQS